MSALQLKDSIGRKIMTGSLKPNTYFEISRQTISPSGTTWVVIYRSNPVLESFKPTWDRVELDLETFCNGDLVRVCVLFLCVFPTVCYFYVTTPWHDFSFVAFYSHFLCLGINIIHNTNKNRYKNKPNYRIDQYSYPYSHPKNEVHPNSLDRSKQVPMFYLIPSNEKEWTMKNETMSHL
mmetsp:Transcript_33778/g.50840  ORF Transcript_33778/g.50840 Transcript_33778/m.50840 type:complete len:179 (+) Transcript_33778:853-1389(+)